MALNLQNVDELFLSGLYKGNISYLPSHAIKYIKKNRRKTTKEIKTVIKTF